MKIIERIKQIWGGKPAPVVPPPGGVSTLPSDNPAIGIAQQTAPLEVLAQVLRDCKLAFTATPESITLQNGYVLETQLVESRQLESGVIRSATLIQLRHPDRVPAGLVEYQHAIGASIDEAMRNGFMSWVKVDLVVLADALLQKPVSCTPFDFSASTLVVPLPASRRVLLGHPVQFTSETDAEKAEDALAFDPAGLFRECLAEFSAHLQGADFYGIRLFAARDANGVISADCRVNGADFPPAVAALEKYVAAWPVRGIEYRKQFVVIQSC